MKNKNPTNPEVARINIKLESIPAPEFPPSFV